MTTRMIAVLLLLAATTPPALADPAPEETNIRCLAAQPRVTQQQSIEACTSLIETTYRDDPVRLAGAYYDRSNTYRWMKRDDLALKDLDAAVKLQPNEKVLIMARALLLGDMGRTEDAIRDLGAAMRAGYDAANILNRRGFLYVKLGRLDEAMADFTELMKVEVPGTSDGLFGRGVVRLKRGEAEAGKADIARAVQIDRTVGPRNGFMEYQ
jgi:tetratricopeptide (TPR) repeat protein